MSGVVCVHYFGTKYRTFRNVGSEAMYCKEALPQKRTVGGDEQVGEGGIFRKVRFDDFQQNFRWVLS